MLDKERFQNGMRLLAVGHHREFSAEWLKIVYEKLNRASDDSAHFERMISKALEEIRVPSIGKLLELLIETGQRQRSQSNSNIQLAGFDCPCGTRFWLWTSVLNQKNGNVNCPQKLYGLCTKTYSTDYLRGAREQYPGAVVVLASPRDLDSGTAH